MGLTVDVTLPSAEEIESLVGSDHDEVLLALERVRRRVDASIADVVDHADRHAQYLADGHRNSAGWIRAVTNWSPGESRRRTRVVRALRDLPSFRDHLRDGTVGVEQV